MSLERLEALRHDLKKCVRCSLCKLVPLPTIRQTRFTSACPLFYSDTINLGNQRTSG